ncbi:MAG: molybdenum cofactor biosynthesis protein MoaE [Nitrospinae bacterium]|nr:molybdenum cofactor biosynthesis protein MoaE [Nitrospinota bacterium]
MIRIQREDFDVKEQTRYLLRKDNRAGAVVFFVGTARGQSRGMDIIRLEFECYSDMAQKTLLELERDAKAKFGILECGIIHRIGEIGIGENIVFVGVTSIHRASAFDACEWLIDELKKRTPIWKKEFTRDGAHWVENHP